MQEYVLGFMFDSRKDRVLLIEKQKPTWQRGKYNEIGGKVEEGETPLEAMVREFTEEVGYATAPSQWSHFASMKGHVGWRVECFMSYGQIDTAQQMESEVPGIFPTSRIPYRAISNLHWLIPMALDEDNFIANIQYPEI